jgi:hypothetical protein
MALAYSFKESRRKGLGEVGEGVLEVLGATSCAGRDQREDQVEEKAGLLVCIHKSQTFKNFVSLKPKESVTL